MAGLTAKAGDMAGALGQQRYRAKARRALVELWGGFCGAGAPAGVGCGRVEIGGESDPTTQRRLEFAHLRPTGLAGRSRGWERRVADVRNHPFDYALLCPPCHRHFDGTIGPRDDAL